MYPAHKLLQWLMIAEGQLICGLLLVIDYQRCGIICCRLALYQPLNSNPPSLPVRSLVSSWSLVEWGYCSTPVLILLFLVTSFNSIILFPLENYTYLRCLIMGKGTFVTLYPVFITISSFCFCLCYGYWLLYTCR